MKFKAYTFLFLFLLLQAAPAVGKQLVDRVIAVVNDEVITQSEFDLIFRPIYEQIRKAYRGSNLEEELQATRLKLLNQLIEDKLVYQEAKKLGVEVLDSEIFEQVENFQSQFPDDETYQAELNRVGLTRGALEEQFRERLTIARLHRQIIHGRVVVSPVEVEKFYKENAEKFVRADQIDVWSITIRKSEEAVQKGITDEVKQGRAAELLAELNGGAEFGELAKQASEDLHAEKGGHVGYIERGNFVQDIDDMLFALEENSHSEVVETERGYHIFKVTGKQPGAALTFEEVKEKIEDQLFRKKAHERFMSWMEKLKKKSYISIR
jgi:peptidyl-prolyl cis-trans isomerase SurA